MLKMKIALDSSNAAEMHALSVFAASLAEAHKDDNVKLAHVLIADRPTTFTTTASEQLPVDAVVTVSEQETPPLEKDPDKPKRTRKPAEPAEKQAAEKVPAEEPEAPKPAEQPKPVSKITLDDVRRAVAEKKDVHLEVMKFKLREEFGVAKTPDLKEEDYEKFYNFVNSL
jgi:outer membrane biosynthesis protein TonB